jgi:hypothetical protein
MWRMCVGSRSTRRTQDNESSKKEYKSSSEILKEVKTPKNNEKGKNKRQ